MGKDAYLRMVFIEQKLPMPALNQNWKERVLVPLGDEKCSTLQASPIQFFLHLLQR